MASTLFNQVSIALRRISDQCDADDGWLVGWLRRRRKKKKRKKKKKKKKEKKFPNSIYHNSR